MKKNPPKWTGPSLPTTALHLEAVGMVAMEWAWLGIIVETAIWRLLRVRGHVGIAVTVHIAPRVRLDILLSLANLKMNKPDYERLSLLVGRIRELTGLRNDIVHAEWTGVKEGEWPPVARFRKRMARGHVRTQDHEKTPAEIIEVATSIFRLSTALLDFFHDTGVFTGVSRTKL